MEKSGIGWLFFNFKDHTADGSWPYAKIFQLPGSTTYTYNNHLFFAKKIKFWREICAQVQPQLCSELSHLYETHMHLVKSMCIEQFRTQYMSVISFFLLLSQSVMPKTGSKPNTAKHKMRENSDFNLFSNRKQILKTSPGWDLQSLERSNSEFYIDYKQISDTKKTQTKGSLYSPKTQTKQTTKLLMESW